jgi:hypothetical protein
MIATPERAHKAAKSLEPIIAKAADAIPTPTLTGHAKYRVCLCERGSGVELPAGKDMPPMIVEAGSEAEAIESYRKQLSIVATPYDYKAVKA